jgi:hypothetical protein
MSQEQVKIKNNIKEEVDENCSSPLSNKLSTAIEAYSLSFLLL